jgi:glycosyl transferase family 25
MSQVIKLAALTISCILVLIFTIYEGSFVLKPTPQDLKSAVIENEEMHKGVGTYIISLDRSVARYEKIKPLLAKLSLPVEKINAVDGSKLPFKEIERKVDIGSYINFMGKAPQRGTIGCSLSHIKTWETFLASDFEYALILEDDITFNPSLLLNSIQDLIKHSTMWDMVTFEIHHRGLPLMVEYLPHINRELSVYLTSITHSGAYLINRETARKFLAKALPIKMPIDHYFTRSWELDVRILGIEPRIVHQTFGDSEINNTKRVGEKSQNNNLEKINIQRFVFNVESAIMRFAYNIALYVKEILA